MLAERVTTRTALMAAMVYCAAAAALPSWSSLVVALPVLISAPAACFWCAHASRARDRSAYVWFGVGWIMFFVVNLQMLIWRAQGVPVPPATSVDVLVVVAYLAMTAGFVHLTWKRYGTRDLESWIDAAIVGVALVGSAVAAVATPILESETSTLYTVALLAYPSLAIITITAGCRIAFATGRSRPSERLLLISALFGLLCEVVAGFIEATGRESATTSPRNFCVLAAFTFFATAALHPSARAQTSVQTKPAAPSRRRTIGLLAAVTLLPIVGLHLLANKRLEGLYVVLAASALTGVGVVARLSLALGRVAQHAALDPLTGLLNRRGVVDTFARQEASATEPVAVLFIDLDGFKRINDEHGHHVGDEVLVAVAQRLRSTVRQHDLAARLGGDEFALVLRALPADDPQGAMTEVAERVVTAFTEPIDVSVGSVTVSVSVGASLYDPDDAPVNALFENADRAMYDAKRRGKAQFVVAPWPTSTS